MLLGHSEGLPVPREPAIRHSAAAAKKSGKGKASKATTAPATKAGKKKASRVVKKKVVTKASKPGKSRRG